MARRGRQCVVDGCWRRARPGQLVCRDHQKTGLGKELGREVAKLEREIRALLVAANPDEARDAGRRFRRKLERGEFAALFAGKMQALFAQSNAEEPLRDEIAALRIAMMRLLVEENDAAALAKGLSQVTNATVRALRAQKELEGEQVTAGMLERSLEKLEAATRELSEEEELAIEERRWKREVGWTKADERAWKSPENQRRVLQEGMRKAMERQERRARRMGGAHPRPLSFQERGAELDNGASAEENPYPPAPFPSAEGQGEKPLTLGPSSGSTLTPGVPLPEPSLSGKGVSPNPERWENGKKREYANELERLFWEDPDPFAYQRELERLMEEGGG